MSVVGALISRVSIVLSSRKYRNRWSSISGALDALVGKYLNPYLSWSQSRINGVQPRKSCESVRLSNES